VALPAKTLLRSGYVSFAFILGRESGVGRYGDRTATNLGKHYFQTEWPRRTRAYEYGVYTDQVLQNFFMPGMYVLTNLSAV
jgi:hypothetical protein